MSAANSQELLWALVGPWFWTGYSVVCTLAAVLWFKMLLDSHERDAAFLGRILMLGGFILGAFVRINSGCQPLSGALLATGGAFWALLATTRWRTRPGGPWTKALAVAREALGGREKQPR